MELETCLSAPGDWQRVTIEDVCVKFTSGGTPSRRRPEFYQDGIVPWVKTKELLDVILQDAEEWITEEAIADSSAKRLPRNTVLMAMYGATVGQLGILGREMACNQACAAMIVDDAKCDYRFLYYLLLANRRQIVSMATGAAQQNLSGAQIKGWTIALPEREEQRAIAHILGTLDYKIELNRRRNQTLEAMARALFKDWFVDFGPVRAKMEGREPYLPADLWQLFPDRLDDEGKPEGWETVPASDLIEFNPTEPLRKGTPAPYLDMASLPTSGSWPEPPIMRDFGSGMRFRNGDTLLARITPCLENGKTAFVQCLPDNTVGWGSTEYIVMRPKTPTPAEYAYLLARDDAFREHAIRSMTGTSGRQRAQGDSVAAFKLASPLDENLWHAFARQITPIFDNIKSNAKTSETLSALRDTLLPKLISGELRINDAEKLLQQAEDNVPNKKRSLP